MVLSGGERRRTRDCARWPLDPHFVLPDEPFAGVDPIAVEEIQSIVSGLKKKNIGILITDHNVDETLTITDRAYLMVEGSYSGPDQQKTSRMTRWYEKSIWVRTSRLRKRAATPETNAH